MRVHVLFILSLLGSSLQALGDIIIWYGGRYTDCNGKTIPCRIRFDDGGWRSRDNIVMIQYQFVVSLEDSVSGNPHQFMPGTIQEYSFKKGTETFTFQSVMYAGHFYFLKPVCAGASLQEYLYYTPATTKSGYANNILLFKKGAPPYREQWPGDRIGLSHYLSDYPLLSAMIRKGQVTLWGKENEDVVNEYNQWLSEPTDTSLTLRGILDADRYVKSFGLFWKYWTLGLTTPVSFLYLLHLAKHDEPIPMRHIPGRLRADPVYMKAYKDRAASRQWKAEMWGYSAGLFSEIILVIALK